MHELVIIETANRFVFKGRVNDHDKRIGVLRDTSDTMGTTTVSKVPDYWKSMSCETE